MYDKLQSKILLCLICILLPLALVAKSSQFYNMPAYDAWFTGPLLSPTPVNMALGHPAIEPIMTFTATYGNYDNQWKTRKAPTIWSINPSLDFQFALSKNWGLEFYPGFIVNFSQGKEAAFLQDTHVFLGYQIADENHETWVPNIRLTLHQVYPTGKFRNLDPAKNGIDATGSGSFQFGPLLIVQKQFAPYQHYFNIEASIGYVWAIPTHVSGFNYYGGGYNTSGTIRTGNTLWAFLAFEYGITQKWVVASDFFLQSQTASPFSGKHGSLDGQAASVGLPSNNQLSITPSIEYNLSQQLGFLMGTWLSIAGQNSQAFVSIFGAMVYTF